MNNQNQKRNVDDGFKLTTDEAKKLIDELKQKVIESNLSFPTIGKKIEFDVIAKNDGTKFVINIARSSVNQKKCTYQGRTYINSTPLLRLDITNASHMNSDGTKITGNHIHIYNENTEMSEAIPFNINNAGLYEYCIDFFKQFNIIQENWDIIYQEEI